MAWQAAIDDAGRLAEEAAAAEAEAAAEVAETKLFKKKKKPSAPWVSQGSEVRHWVTRAAEPRAVRGQPPGVTCEEKWGVVWDLRQGGSKIGS